MYTFCRKYALSLENNLSFLKYFTIHPLPSKGKWGNLLYGIAWKALHEVSVLGVFLVLIFRHSDWIRRNTEYLKLCISPCPVRMAENKDQKNSEYGTFDAVKVLITSKKDETDKFRPSIVWIFLLDIYNYSSPDITFCVIRWTNFLLLQLYGREITCLPN